MQHTLGFIILSFLCVSLWAVPLTGDLIGDGDLPSANLYSSGGGDSAPANLSTSTDAALGLYSLRVQAGTVINGGGTLGGICKALPTMTANKRYTFTYWAKALTTPFTLHFSFQSGNGDENSLSHNVTLSNEWQEYSFTAVLNVARPVFYTWPDRVGATYLIDSIRLYEVSTDTLTGFIVCPPVPEPYSILLIALGLTMLGLRRKTLR